MAFFRDEKKIPKERYPLPKTRVNKVTKRFSRTPKGYDGTEITTHALGNLLPHVMAGISAGFGERPDLILESWPQIIGAKLAPMTRALSFKEGVLRVKVMNSTLYTLLSQHEEKRLLQQLQARFPDVVIRKIEFRIG